METKNQEEVWDAIAEEWDEFKEIPSEFSREFLLSCKGKILDLGSGSGRHLINIPEGEMYLVDFSEEMLKLAEKKAERLGIDAYFQKGNLWEVPYPENFFDNVICISALHCIEPDKHKKVAKEIYRVLKPSGKALIGVWNFNSKRFKNKRKKGKEHLIGWRNKGKRYYYLFEEDEVHKLFEDAGFKIIQERNSEMMINFVVEKI